MDPRGGGGDEGDEEDRGVEGGEMPSVLGGFAQLTIAPAPLEEDRVNLNAPLNHGATTGGRTEPERATAAQHCLAGARRPTHHDKFSRSGWI